MDGVTDPLALDEVIHAPKRLAICAFLQRVDSVEFGAIRDAIGVSDSVLSKHLTVLAQTGYIALDKRRGPGERRPRTWVWMTPSGRTAFALHVAALRAIVDGP